MSGRDTFVQLGYLLISLGAIFATWALLTGPLGKITGLAHKPAPKRRKKPDAAPTPEDDPGT